jgi:hypothetical protein
MAFPIKICIICEEEFELKPDKPGYANRCPSCSTAEAAELIAQHPAATTDREADAMPCATCSIAKTAKPLLLRRLRR